jgi:hypothetical protein
MAAPEVNNDSVVSHGARAVMVNRTHRVVREQALTMQAQRKRSRSLWGPLVLCSVLLIVVCYAMWALLDGYNLVPNGVPDASDQMMLLLVWSLPVTAVVLGLVWLKRERSKAGLNANADYRNQGEVRR